MTEARTIVGKRNDFPIGPADAPLIDRLPADHRRVLAATGTYSEIAEQLSIPIGTVKSRLYRARLSLQVLRARTHAIAAATEDAPNIAAE